jgi:DNA-directed RNA polymerase alpha subunit
MSVDERKRRVPKRSGLNTSTWTEAERRQYAEKRMLETPIAEMELSVRIINTLEVNNIILCKDLMRQTWKSLTNIKNFGEKTFTECRSAIKTLGLTPPRWRRPQRSKRIPKIKGKA